MSVPDIAAVVTARPVLRFTFGFWTSTKWTDRRELSWPELIEVLTTHEVGQKEGTAIVPATFRSDRRVKSDAEEIGVAFLDSDTGRTLDEIEASVRACGWAAVISSSYSHLTIQTKVSRSNVDKFRHDNTHSTAADFLVNDKGMLPRVAAGAHVAGEDDKFVYFEHQPCPKFRVAIRLLRPWRASDYPTQDAANAAWKERIEALAAALGLQHDQSCTDTSRLFYLPRRAANAPPPATRVIDGNPCDLFAIPACARAGKAYGAGLFDGGNGQVHPDADTGEFVDPDTGEVFDLRVWARDYGGRFRIAAALRARKPSILTGHIADSVKVHCRCPNEDRHTKPGADGATFVVNADDSNNGGFVVHCRHGHCTGMDRLAFVRLMLEQRWLSTPDLTTPAFLVSEPPRRPEAGQHGRLIDAEQDCDEQPSDAGNTDTGPDGETAESEEGANTRGILDHEQGALPDLFVMKADLPLVSQRLRDRLARHERLFERGGPARLTCYPPEENRPAEIHPLNVEGTIHGAHEVCRPYQIDARGKRSNVTLPERVAKLYLALNGRWHLRPLHGICGSVLLTDDGSIHAHEGYHAPSGMWCTRAPLLTVPDRPAKDEAVDALYRLRAAMRTFTFKGSLLTRIDGIDADVVDIEQKPGLCESAALCGLLTAVCRASLPLAPGVMISAPSMSGSGAGKGLLARMIVVIAFGIIAKAGTAGHDEQELEKRIGASLLRGEPVLLLDNLNNTMLRSAQLESCLTEPIVSVRLFGLLKMQDVHSTAFVVVTGNGLQASGDTARRFIYPTIEPPLDNPEQRQYPPGFLDGILARRAELLSDCLTIWRWGRQQTTLTRGLPFGSYERWTTWVRDPLLALGCADPVKGVQEARKRDPARVNMTALFTEWRVWHGGDWMKADDLNPAVRRLIDDRERTAAIRQKLSPLVNTRLDGFMLESEVRGNAANAVSLYRVVEIESD